MLGWKLGTVGQCREVSRGVERARPQAEVYVGEWTPLVHAKGTVEMLNRENGVSFIGNKCYRNFLWFDVYNV